MKHALACAAAILGLSAIPVMAQQVRNTCYPSQLGDDRTYCIFTIDQGETKKIIVSESGGRRQGDVVVTYSGTSFEPGSRFSDDIYDQGARTVLKYFGKDKIVLQTLCDPQSDCPEWVYYR